MNKKVKDTIGIIAMNYVDLIITNGEWMGGPEPYPECVKRINPLILFGAMYKSHVIYDAYKTANANEMKNMVGHLLSCMFNELYERIDVDTVDFEENKKAEEEITAIFDTIINANYKNLPNETD